MHLFVETNEQNLFIHPARVPQWVTSIHLAAALVGSKEPKCEWTRFSSEAKWCLLTFCNAWDAGASLEAELVVAARAQEGSDEKASERVSPDYRMMRDGWKMRQRKQLGPPRPASAALSLEHTGPQIMWGRQSLSCSGWRFLSGQARSWHVDSFPPCPPP